MKKIIALVVAILMIASMSVVAFAANITSPEETGSTLLEYGVTQEYVVTIPASLDLTGETDVDVSVAAGYAIPYDTDLTITVGSTNSWKLKDAETVANTAAIDYDIVDDEANSLKDAVVLTAPAKAVSTDVAESFTVDIDESTIPSIVATYTDYLTFTVAIG